MCGVRSIHLSPLSLSIYSVVSFSLPSCHCFSSLHDPFVMVLDTAIQCSVFVNMYYYSKYYYEPKHGPGQCSRGKNNECLCALAHATAHVNAFCHAFKSAESQKLAATLLFHHTFMRLTPHNTTGRSISLIINNPTSRLCQHKTQQCDLLPN